MKLNSWVRAIALFLCILLPLLFTEIGSARPATITVGSGLSQGQLDSTFGEGGLVTTDMYRDSHASAVALQADGKLVVAGNVVSTVGSIPGAGITNDFALTRYNRDGSLDDSFGDQGMVSTDFNSKDDTAAAVALQDDGKIIVAGMSSSNTGVYCVLARYLSDGSLDPAFGVDGKVTGLFSGGWCHAITLQTDGKILVTGEVSTQTFPNDIGFEITRLNADGSLDASFGDQGVVKTFSSGTLYYGNTAVLQEDGKLLVAGSAAVGVSSLQFALARYDPEGNLDPQFGTDGIVISAFDGRNGAWAVAIQLNHQIVVAGSFMNDDYSYQAVALARFNANGSLDTGFGTGGRATAQIGGAGFARAVALQADNHIVTAGDNYRDFILSRWDENGSLDTSFGQDGAVITDLGGSEQGYSAVMQADGKMILAGVTNNTLYDNIALARYGADGSLDSDFGTGGQVITQFGDSFDTAYAIASQPDGKAVIAGSSSGGRTWLFSLSRYNPDGSLDDSFGRKGISLTRIADKDSLAYALAIQPDAKIVVAGGTVSGALGYFDFVVARYNPDGSLDPSFGSGGLVITSAGDGRGGANAVALQPDGKIVAAGWVSNGSDFMVVRYAANGSLDPTFGNGGIVTTDFKNQVDRAYALLIQPDGMIVVAGMVIDSDQKDFGLARYDPNGGLDAAFGENGKVVTDFGGEDIARAITLQKDGKLLVAGDSNGSAMLARYNSDGSLDTSFGGGLLAAPPDQRGAVRVPTAGAASARALVLQADGKILLAGQADGDFLLARYIPDGSLDTGFGTGGVISTDFGGNADAGQGMALGNGRVIVAGSSNRNDNSNFAAARYWLVKPSILYLPCVLH